jgi:hypothetical protein
MARVVSVRSWLAGVVSTLLLCLVNERGDAQALS